MTATVLSGPISIPRRNRLASESVRHSMSSTAGMR